MDAILRTLERLLVWVQVGLGGETPWVSTCKGIFFSSLTHQKVVIPFLGGFPSDRLQCFFFFDVTFFYIWSSGQVCKNLSDFVRIFHWLLSCWPDPPNAGSLWLTHRLWTRISATGRSKNRAKFTFHNFMAKRNHMERHKKWKSSTWTCILVAVSQCVYSLLSESTIQNGDETFKAPNLHLMWQDSVALAAIRDMLAWSGKPKKSKALEFCFWGNYVPFWWSDIGETQHNWGICNLNWSCIQSKLQTIGGFNLIYVRINTFSFTLWVLKQGVLGGLKVVCAASWRPHVSIALHW